MSSGGRESLQRFDAGDTHALYFARGTRDSAVLGQPSGRSFSSRITLGRMVAVLRSAFCVLISTRASPTDSELPHAQMLNESPVALISVIDSHDIMHGPRQSSQRGERP
jgi:hypothetical protein